MKNFNKLLKLIMNKLFLRKIGILRKTKKNILINITRIQSTL